MDKFKQIWNNPRYNALIRLGLWFIFFTLVIVFIRLSPKEEVPKKEEKVQITYNDIKKEFTDYFDYFDNQVDMKIDIAKNTVFLYKVNFTIYTYIQ